MSCSVLLVANQAVFCKMFGWDTTLSDRLLFVVCHHEWIGCFNSVLNSFISLCNLKALGYAITSLSFTLPVMLKKQISAYQLWVDHSFAVGLDNTVKMMVAVFPR